MKCKNCAANYKTRELKCPYCGTENLIGKLWKVQRSDAELEYNRAQKEMGKKSSPYIADRILNRIIILTIVIGILIFVGVFLFYFLAEKINEFKAYAKRDEIKQQVITYYENGEYDKINDYIDQYRIDLEEEYFPYVQAALMYNEYNWYLNYKYNYLSMTDEEKMKDNYELEALLRYSVNVYMSDRGSYSDLRESNRELHETYQAEIMSAWIAVLHLTDEEIAYITDEDTFLYSEDYENLANKINERSMNDGSESE